MDLKDSIITKDESIASLHYKYEDLVQCQTIEIPIYSVQQAKKTKRSTSKTSSSRSKSLARSKSQNKSNIAKSHLHFVREMAEEEDCSEIFNDDDDVAAEVQTVRSQY